MARTNEIGWTPVEDGDPEQAGSAYLVTFRTSREIRVEAHWRPNDEHILVVNGPFEFGFGDEFRDEALQPRARHFARYAEGTIVEVRGVGPFESNYVAPRQREKETAS